MSKYAAIIERLEAATGPDRWLDALVWAATLPTDGVGFDGFGAPEGGTYEYEADEDGSVLLSVVFADMTVKRARRPSPEFTDSIDADLWLVERRLPNAMRRIYDNDEGGCTIDIVTDIGGRFTGDHSTWPVAILLALFRALEAQEASNEA